MIAISQHFSEEHYLVGESLCDSGAVISAEKSKGNLWLVTVLDGDMYDVAVKGFGTKKRVEECHCSAYRAEKQCPHIVAALLRISNEVRNTAESNTVKTTLPTTLTLSSVLAEISHSELEQFVKRVAKTDKSFSALLKTVFAPKVNLADNAQKYTALLHPYVKPVTSIEQKPAASDLRLALKLMSEMHDQMEDAITLEQYTLVFDIIKGTFAKMHYLCHHYKLVRAKLEKIILATNAHIRAMYEASLAPALKAELDVLLTNICCLSYYNYIDKDNEVPLTLHRHSRNTAVQAIATHLSKMAVADRADTVRILAVATLLESAPSDMAELSDQIVIEAADLLVDWNADELAISLLQRQQKSSDRNRALEYALIDFYYRTGRTTEADALSVDLFVNHREFRFLRRIKNHHDGLIPKSLEKNITKKLSASTNLTFRALYYKEVRDDESLLDILRQANDLQLLMQYDYYLYSKQYTELEAIYLQSLDYYLGQHAGSAATYFVEEVMRHLEDIDAMKLARALKIHLEKNYPQRVGIELYK